MYYQRYFPFYMTCINPETYQEEWLQEKESAIMKTYYPAAARRIQEKIEQKCDLLDYEGSRIYDEYPDPYMMKRECEGIRTEIEKELRPELKTQCLSERYLEELVEVLFYQELARRRCRKCRCRRFF